jgi:hypothetical protein
MIRNSALTVLALCLACGVVRAEAQKPARKCPVVIGQIELSYNHQGGQSKPELKVSFGNDSSKQVSTVIFSLSLLDSGGYPHPYPDDLTYRDGVEAGKEKVFTWELAPESVDMHRTGEAVVVLKVEFAGTSGQYPASWTDDGSESCKLTVDYHAR